jgi:CheY-like chemotaxis protein
MSKQQAPSILVVDDEAWIREFYRLVLDGYQVLEAENSESALDIAKHSRLEMVITDCERPGKMDGLHFTARMRRDYPTVPTLMATGNVFADFRRKAFRAGVHSFLGKPFGREELLQAVHHVLSNVRYGYRDLAFKDYRSK